MHRGMWVPEANGTTYAMVFCSDQPMCSENSLAKWIILVAISPSKFTCEFPPNTV